MKKQIPNTVCDDCLNAECVWRAPSWGIDPPVMDCPDKKAPPVTNYDRLVSRSPEEMAEYLAERSVAPSCTGKCHKDYEVYGDLRTFCHDCWLEYLKRVVEE